MKKASKKIGLKRNQDTTMQLLPVQTNCGTVMALRACFCTQISKISELFYALTGNSGTEVKIKALPEAKLVECGH